MTSIYKHLNTIRIIRMTTLTTNKQTFKQKITEEKKNGKY